MNKAIGSISLIAIVTILVFSCKKDFFKSKASSISNEDITNIKNWIIVQQNKSAVNDKNWIDSLNKSIDWENTETTKFNEQETLIAIPILLQVEKKVSSKYLSVANHYTKNELVLIKDKTGQIRLGNIVQITNTTGIKSDIVNFIKSIYNNRNNEYNGSFTVLTIRKNIVFELQYDNGNKVVFASVDKNVMSNRGVIIKTTNSSISQNVYKKTLSDDNECYDYYLNIYINGVLVDMIYLYSSPGCYEESINPDPGGGGGEGIGSSTTLVDIQPVKDSLTTPCMDSAFKAVSDTSIQNLISTFYKNTYVSFGSTVTLVVKEASHVYGSSGTNDILANSDPNSATNTWTITLSDYYENNNSMTQEAWGMVIIHELLHSFINLNYPGVVKDTLDHEFILKNLITPTQQLMMRAFGMDETTAKAMALNGIGDLFTTNTAAAGFRSYAESTYGVTSAQADTAMAKYMDGRLGKPCGH